MSNKEIYMAISNVFDFFVPPHTLYTVTALIVPIYMVIPPFREESKDKKNEATVG